MSLETPTGGDTGHVRSRWVRFHEWRAGRPFAGGVLLCVAGLLIAWVPMQFAFELMLVGGGYTYIGLVWAIGVFLTGAFALRRPELSTPLGVAGVALSILSLLGALGGLFVGMLLGIVGGNLCVAWKPADEGQVDVDAERGDSGDGDGGGGEGDPDGGVDEEGDGRDDGDGFRFGDGDEGDDGAGFEFGDGGEDGADGGDGDNSIIDRDWSMRGTSDGGQSERSPSNVVGRLGSTSSARHLARVLHLEGRPSARTSRPSGGTLASFIRAARAQAESWTHAGSQRTHAGSRNRRGRRAIVVALLVVTSGTIALAGVGPAAGILGDDDETTYTVDTEEIRLDGDGEICATSVASETYRVVLSEATLVNATIYQQNGGETLKSEFPTLEVAEPMVMYTTGQDDELSLLSTTIGCTRSDQTSRTVFRNRYQTSSLLRGAEGVRMLNVGGTDDPIPEPGGFQFVDPTDENATANDELLEGIGGGTDVVDEITDGSGDGSADDGTSDRRISNGTAGNQTGPLAPTDAVAAVTDTVVDRTVDTLPLPPGIAALLEDTVSDVGDIASGGDTSDPDGPPGVGGLADVTETADRTGVAGGDSDVLGVLEGQPVVGSVVNADDDVDSADHVGTANGRLEDASDGASTAAGSNASGTVGNGTAGELLGVESLAGSVTEITGGLSTLVADGSNGTRTGPDGETATVTNASDGGTTASTTRDGRTDQAPESTSGESHRPGDETAADVVDPTGEKPDSTDGSSEPSDAGTGGSDQADGTDHSDPEERSGSSDENAVGELVGTTAGGTEDLVESVIDGDGAGDGGGEGAGGDDGTPNQNGNVNDEGDSGSGASETEAVA